MKSLRIEIEENLITISIEKTRNKNMYLRVRKDGSLLCSVPYGTSEKIIQSFIESRANWIKKTQKVIQKRNEMNAISEENEIYILGQKKYIVIAYSRRTTIEETEEAIYFLTPKYKQVSQDKLVKKYIQQKMLELIEINRSNWDEKICKSNRLQLPDIKLRDMKSRWGVCFPNKHSITLSTRLIHYPVECFEYVLLHEYAHFLVPNHSKEFYEVIEKYMPDYKERIKKMR